MWCAPSGPAAHLSEKCCSPPRRSGERALERAQRLLLRPDRVGAARRARTTAISVHADAAEPRRPPTIPRQPYPGAQRGRCRPAASPRRTRRSTIPGPAAVRSTELGSGSRAPASSISRAGNYAFPGELILGTDSPRPTRSLGGCAVGVVARTPSEVMAGLPLERAIRSASRWFHRSARLADGAQGRDPLGGRLISRVGRTPRSRYSGRARARSARRARPHHQHGA